MCVVQFPKFPTICSPRRLVLVEHQGVGYFLLLTQPLYFQPLKLKGKTHGSPDVVLQSSSLGQSLLQAPKFPWTWKPNLSTLWEHQRGKSPAVVQLKCLTPRHLNGNTQGIFLSERQILEEDVIFLFRLCIKIRYLLLSALSSNFCVLKIFLFLGILLMR